jgi:hypothetical protein
VSLPLDGAKQGGCSGHVYLVKVCLGAASDHACPMDDGIAAVHESLQCGGVLQVSNDE